MIKGFRFTNQLANAEVDARIHQEFLNKNDGIFYGMNLSKTTNTVTISEGLCEIAGRPVAVINSETVTAGTDSLYCVLVLEIDLSKESTRDTFSQVSFKLLTSSTGYSAVTQQDINKYSGTNTIYQLEFARFKTGTNGITDFTDTRKFLSFSGIYAQIKADCEAVMEQIKQELANVKDGSAYVLNEVKHFSTNYVDSQSGLVIDYTFQRFGKVVDVAINAHLPLNEGREINKDNFSVPTIPEWARPNTTKYFRAAGLQVSASTTKIDALVNLTLFESGSFLTYIRSYTDGQNVRGYYTYIVDDSEEQYMLGDVDGNGTIEQADLEKLNAYLVGNIPLSAKEFAAGDITKDGKIDSADTLKLSKYLSGAIDTLE